MFELKDIQKELLVLLTEIDQICRKHDIPYYLSGGTLLGALRHEGFIPWDDDADINMTREAYEKFEAVIDDELRPDRELLSCNRFPDYTSPIARYSKLDSTNVVRGRSADGCPHGIFIDVIILDPIPKDPDALLEWKKQHYAYCELLEYPYAMAARRCDWDAIDIPRYQAYKKRSKTEGKKAVLDEIANDIFTISESDADQYCMRFGTMWLGIMPIEWFGTPRELPFEGHSFMAPQKSEEEMNLFYRLGWKQIISRKSAHIFLSHPYLDSGNCEREYFSLIEREDFRTLIDEYNEQLIPYYMEIHNRQLELTQPFLGLLRYRIKRQFEEHGEDYFRNNPEKGFELFQDYIGVQSSSLYASNGLKLRLSDDEMKLMFETAVGAGKVSEAKVIMDLYHSEMSSVPGIDELARRIDVMYQLESAIDRKDADAVSEMLAQCAPEDRNTATAICAELIKQGNVSSISDASVAFARAKAEEYPDNGDIMKYAADILRKAGFVEEAMSMYSAASLITTNGLLLLEMKHLGVENAARVLEAAGTDEWEKLHE